MPVSCWPDAVKVGLNASRKPYVPNSFTPYVVRISKSAGIVNSGGNVLGMMPHPERVAEPELGGTDGLLLFRSVIAAFTGVPA